MRLRRHSQFLDSQQRVPLDSLGYTGPGRHTTGEYGLSGVLLFKPRLLPEKVITVYST